MNALDVVKILEITEEDVSTLGYNEDPLKMRFIMFINKDKQNDFTGETITEFIGNYLEKELYDDDQGCYTDKDGCELCWDERVELALEAFEEKHKGKIRFIQAYYVEAYCN